ncbi:MAG: hypothetical protein QXG01_02635, partial [Candidatus Bathyarchaeia archaeon]
DVFPETSIPNYPPHYIYTAVTQALATFKSYRELSRKRKDFKLPNINGLRAIHNSMRWRSCGP